MAEFFAAPAYLINLDRRPDRLQAAVSVIQAAGYHNVARFAAVDGQDHDALARDRAARVPVQSTAAFVVTREVAAAMARTIRVQAAVGVIDQLIPELQAREFDGDSAGFGYLLLHARQSVERPGSKPGGPRASA